jgi:acetyl esterase/lipase
MMGRNFRLAFQSFAWMSLVLLPLVATAQSGALRERLLQRHGATAQHESRGPVNLPPGARLVQDVAYGSDPRQRFDVYLPAHASAAPVIFMVHGGGWRRGDKAARGVVQNKVDRWLPRGFVVISANYRLLPDATPLQQAQDVARALALAQRKAQSWGADPRAFILMGHSAGAHLVVLLSAEPALAREQGAQPWLGTVSLDSAALDVVQIMQGRHPRLYDDAFGSQPADWLAASPYQQMRGRMAPFLAVCSSERRESCPRAHDFVRKAKSFGGEARVLEEGLSHGRINAELGLPTDYTDAVERFMRGLSPAVEQRLGPAQPATSSR